MKKAVYRVGDHIRIVNPVFVERVGYPLTWTMLLGEFEASPKIDEAMGILGLSADNDKARADFVKGVCMAAVRSRGWGGRERTLHTMTEEFAKGLILEVLAKRKVMTGTYCPPSGGYSYDGEYDYQPGYLEHAQAHVLLATMYGEIESTNVEPAELSESSVIHPKGELVEQSNRI